MRKNFVKYNDKHFTVGGSISNRILIFDIDDTLIYSNATIKVLKNGQFEKDITSAEFNNYILKDDEEFDFTNFDSSKLLFNASLTLYWNILENEYNKGTHIAIITARSKPVMIKNFFLRHGIDIKDELIFCCGYSRFPYKGSIQEKKSKVIEYLYLLGYDEFVFFDDNEDNLKMAKSLENKLDIKVKVVHAKI
jgi:hypothetical protein